MGLLHGLRHGPHVLEAIVCAVPVKDLFGPAFLDDVQRFRTVAQLPPGVPAQARTDGWEGAACPGLEEHPPIREDFHQRHVLRQTHGVPVGQPEQVRAHRMRLVFMATAVIMGIGLGI